MKQIILLIILTFCINLTFGQTSEKKQTSERGYCGISISRAINLPKPPPRIWEKCDCKFDNELEQVIVQVTINEKGDVEEATAISGHPFLRSFAEQAAKNSKFRPSTLDCEPQKTFGEITYSFNLKDSSIYINEQMLLKEIKDLGIINSSATFLPMPKRPPSGTYKVSKDTSIGVQVKVDLQTGDVIESTAIYGFPLFRKSAEDAALQAKFGFNKNWSYAKYGIGVLDYKVKDFISFEQKTTKDKAIKLGIINGRASYLAKPEYPQRAKDFCASGKVEIEILVNESGNVIEAKAISGDDLLIDSAIEAVKKAKFRNIGDVEPVKTRGIIVYNFPKEKNCIFVEKAVNSRAIYIQKPALGSIMGGKHLRLSKDEIVKVEIIINEQGNVTSVKAVLGHILLRQTCEFAARQAKFNPTNDVGKIRIKAFLVYTIKPNGEVEM